MALSSCPLLRNLSAFLLQLIDIDEVNQVLHTNLWLRHEWQDPRLRWNSSYFGGISSLRIDPHKVWKPDIALYNTADGKFTAGNKLDDPIKMTLNSSGHIMWAPPAVFKSTCHMDVTYFPFDVQNCSLKFGSWTYAKDEIDLRLIGHGANLAEYFQSNEWELVDAPAARLGFST